MTIRLIIPSGFLLMFETRGKHTRGKIVRLSHPQAMLPMAGNGVLWSLQETSSAVTHISMIPGFGLSSVPASYCCCCLIAYVMNNVLCPATACFRGTHSSSRIVIPFLGLFSSLHVRIFPRRTSERGLLPYLLVMERMISDQACDREWVAKVRSE
jgi:hypothetical protein